MNKIKRFSKPLFLVLILLIQLNLAANTHWTKEEKKWLKEHPVLRVAPDPTYPPVEYIDEDGNYKGISADYLKLLAKEMKVEFEIVKYETWTEALDAARTRKVDILPAAALSVNRSAYLQGTQPYLIFPNVIVSNIDSDSLTTIEKLKGKRVGIVSSYFWFETVEREYPEIEISPVSNVVEGLRYVSTGQIDAFITTVPIAIYYIQKEGLSNLQFNPQSSQSIQLSILSRNDWPILNSILEKALANIPQNKKDTIYNRWITLKQASIYSTPLFLIIFVAILAACLLALYLSYIWNKILKKEVRKKTRELQQDIEKREVAERELRQSEEKYRRLFEKSSDPIIITENELILDCNISLVNFLEYETRKDIIGKNLTDISPITQPDGMPSFKKIKQQLSLAREKGFSRTEWVHFNKYFDEIWVDISTTFIPENGKNNYYTVWRDITARINSERALKENEALYRSLVNATPDAIVMVDAEGNISFGSPNLFKLFKASSEDVVGSSLESWISDTDKQMVHEYLRKMYLNKSPEICRFNFHNRDNEVFIGEVVSAPLEDGIGLFKGIISLIRDVTEIVDNEKELHRHKDHLEDLVNKRTEELKSINHDLERFNRLYVGHEFRIKKLEEELKKYRSEPE